MKKLLVFLAVCGAFSVASTAYASTGTISGTVTRAADGTPIEGIYITAQNTSTSATTTATTAADGTYSFSLAPGTYDVSPYTWVASEVGIYFIKKTSTVTIAADETKSGQNIALNRRGRFVGHIYSSDGVTPIIGATLSLTHTSGYSSGSGYATSLSNGSYVSTPTANDAAASATGSYTFVVTKAGYFGSSTSGIMLPADDTVVTQDILLTPASAVSGTVRDAGGAAISNATVTLTKSGSWAVYSALTSATGTYTVYVSDLSGSNGTATGEYTLTVAKVGYVSKTAAVSIDTEGAALINNDFTLVSAGTITGTVMSALGGLYGATVTADDGFGHSYSTTTNGGGVYTLASLIPSARYTLTVTKTNYVGQKAYVIAVAAGTTVAGKNFTLTAAKTFSGSILAKSDNAPLEAATVYLYKRNKARSEISDLSVTTKSDGSYLFRNVSPGKYRVKVVKNGYVTAVIDSVTITSTITGRNYKLDLGSTIRGQVYTGKNTAVPSADIAVFALNNGKEIAYASTTSDESGYYLISGLKKGSYRIKVTTTDFVMRVVNVDVKNKPQITSNIKLAAAGSISGYVTDRDTGLPVSVYVRVLGTAASAWSDYNGYYIIDGVAPGSRTVVISNAYYETSSRKGVTVKANQTKTGIGFTLTPKQ